MPDSTSRHRSMPGKRHPASEKIQLPKIHQLGYISPVEKRTPHCKLPLVKALVEAGKVRTTHAARAGANELGLTLADMLEVVMTLTSADFYKSMTAHADHTV